MYSPKWRWIQGPESVSSSSFFQLSVPRIGLTKGKDNLQLSKWEREELFLADLLELNPAANNQSQHYVMSN